MRRRRPPRSSATRSAVADQDRPGIVVFLLGIAFFGHSSLRTARPSSSVRRSTPATSSEAAVRDRLPRSGRVVAIPVRRPQILGMAVLATAIGAGGRRRHRPGRGLQPGRARQRADADDGHHPRLPDDLARPRRRDPMFGASDRWSSSGRRVSRHPARRPCHPRRRARRRRARLRRRRRGARRVADAHPRSELTAQRDGAAARRGQPAAHVLDHFIAGLGFLGFTADPTRPTGV